MKRLLLLVGMFAPATASAVGIVPPIIRVEKADAAEAPLGDDDPLKTIERITKNARAIGDRLQNEDAGADTQKTQDQLLKDIDSLLKPPPPMGGGGSGSPPPPMGGDPPPPMDGGNPPPMGKGGGQQPPPMGQGGGQSKRPRGDRKENPGGAQQPPPMPMGGMNDKKEPQGGMPDPKQPPMDMGSGKEPPGGTAAGIPDGKGKASPNLPLDDPFTRRVWGHLPEQVRQKAMQSYREQFMPRYSEMLKQYYSTLNEKQSPNPMK